MAEAFYTLMDVLRVETMISQAVIQNSVRRWNK